MNGSYCSVYLPDSWKIHPILNIALIQQYPGTCQKKQIIEVEADDAVLKMELNIASGPSDDDPSKHVYSETWEDNSQVENVLEMYDNVLECSLDFQKDYDGNNPPVERDGQSGYKKCRKLVFLLQNDFFGTLSTIFCISTCYNGALLGSPVPEKWVMSGVLP